MRMIIPQNPQPRSVHCIYRCICHYLSYEGVFGWFPFLKLSTVGCSFKRCPPHLKSILLQCVVDWCSANRDCDMMDSRQAHFVGRNPSCLDIKNCGPIVDGRLQHQRTRDDRRSNTYGGFRWFWIPIVFWRKSHIVIPWGLLTIGPCC